MKLALLSRTRFFNGARTAGIGAACLFAVIVAAGIARAQDVPPATNGDSNDDSNAIVDAGSANVVVDAGPLLQAPPPTAATPASPAAAPTSLPKLKLGAGEINQSPFGRLRCFFGALAMIAIAVLFSEDRKRIPWRLVAVGSGLQLLFALLVLKTSAGRSVFGVANDAINGLLGYSTQGARFLFGNLVDMSVPVGRTIGAAPGQSGVAYSVVLEPQYWATTGAFIAFNVLPTIIFFSAVMAFLYHLGAMQWIVKAIAVVMQKSMGTSGAETTSVASNIFLGQTEAPLLIKPYLEKMTRSELMAVMVAGFATVAGGVMAAYVGMLRASFDDIAGHLLAASVMGAPASLVMAKIFVPERDVPETLAGKPVDLPKIDANILDAVSRGTSEGLLLAMNVGAMLIAFTALIAMLNALLGLSVYVGLPLITLEQIFGWVGAPLAFILGVPWDDCVTVGGLIGTKTVVNEFVAYQSLAAILHQPVGQGLHHGVSVVIATYALCGFSNFASIGIQIGGIAAMAPGRRQDVAALGLKAMFCGSLATFQTAAIAAMVL